MTAPLIFLENISYHIGNYPILKNINFSIETGELLTIVGPNGAGKSSLLHIILGHIRPSSGKIQRKKDLRMAYVPQSFHPPVDLPITMRRFLKDIPQSAHSDTLKRLNISHLLDSPLQNLSGGETQRLLLARAMLLQPDLIALDEPAAGIDPAALDNYYQTIRDHQLQSGCAIVMISHDLHLVMAASDRVLCLNKHICCAGKPQDVISHPEFQALTGQSAAIGVYTHHHQHIHL
ncbi:ATP-binding cassette domain-containing protein [Suttonella ornithocola]|uniref:Zinc import ATP-binding protein ZnuC n=1 Tax=Suttonella ornithocola TaxID=279832 RepID=A0A380MTD3_9GAMM|nr:ATP-binding cassette domain-containing protein [Suttonella ornithocola]SUO95815.1 Zinc import ATP-binding protein ZnuC [Suttonella ornithocola]